MRRTLKIRVLAPAAVLSAWTFAHADALWVVDRGAVREVRGTALVNSAGGVRMHDAATDTVRLYPARRIVALRYCGADCPAPPLVRRLLRPPVEATAPDTALSPIIPPFRKPPAGGAARASAKSMALPGWGAWEEGRRLTAAAHFLLFAAAAGNAAAQAARAERTGADYAATAESDRRRFLEWAPRLGRRASWSVFSRNTAEAAQIHREAADAANLSFAVLGGVWLLQAAHSRNIAAGADEARQRELGDLEASFFAGPERDGIRAGLTVRTGGR